MMKKKDNDFLKKLEELLNQTKKSIQENIEKSFISLTKNKTEIKVKDIKQWKNNIILTYVNAGLDKLIEACLNNLNNKETEIINENINKIEYKIESNSEMNIFTPEDIQDENKEITRNFQNEAFNYMNANNEKEENENVAVFLKNVAIISRYSFKEAKNLYRIMEEKYLKITGNKITKNDEKYKKEFSQWIKNLEKKQGKKEYDFYLNQLKSYEKELKADDREYLKKLLYDLIIMYFHCDISFPFVKIDFTKKDDFDPEIMIDFINRGKNRKVNFIILPSLFSNGIYLQNGKFWVFTYLKNTFRFPNEVNAYFDDLLKEEKKEKEESKNECKFIAK